MFFCHLSWGPKFPKDSVMPLPYADPIEARERDKKIVFIPTATSFASPLLAEPTPPKASKWISRTATRSTGTL